MHWLRTEQEPRDLQVAFQSLVPEVLLPSKYLTFPTLAPLSPKASRSLPPFQSFVLPPKFSVQSLEDKTVVALIAMELESVKTMGLVDAGMASQEIIVRINSIDAISLMTVSVYSIQNLLVLTI